MKVDTIKITVEKVDLNTQYGRENEKVPDIGETMEKKQEDPRRLQCH